MLSLIKYFVTDTNGQVFSAAPVATASCSWMTGAALI
jgi:hypothetical protein